MGGLPLIAAVPMIVRNFRGGRPPAAAVKAASTLSRCLSSASLSEELERLDDLHRSGALGDLEYGLAKSKVIRDHGQE